MAKSPRCPETGYACSTAYVKKGCRCAACTEHNRERGSRSYQKNRDTVRKRHAEYYRKNRERIREQGRKYYRANAEKTLARQHARYAAHAEKYRAEERRRREENPEKYREYARMERARNRNRSEEELRAAREAALPKMCKKCGRTKGREGWHGSRDRSDGLSPYCASCTNARNAGRKARKMEQTPAFAKDQAIDRIYAARDMAQGLLGGEYHVDHVKPLARGGLHRFGNLQILPAKQNTAKRDKLESELDWTPEPLPWALRLWILDNGTTDHEENDNG
jgi:hypothetical protein